MDVTLDNVTFLGVPKTSWGACDEYLGMELSADDCSGVRCLGARQLDRVGEIVQAAWMLDGAHISCRLRSGSLGRLWEADTERVPEQRSWPMRVEFNPNKSSARVMWFIAALMRVEKTTRADVALDYEGTVPSDWVFRRDRVHPKVHYSPDLGGIETFYLGGVSSDRFIRVYDKVAERIAAKALPRNEYHEVMRVEGVGRHRYVLQEPLFDGVQVYSPQVPSWFTFEEKLLAGAWLHEPQALRGTGLSRASEYRLRKGVKDLCRRELKQLDPHPADVYRDQRGRLLDEVEGLQCGVWSTRAKVYEEEQRGRD